MFESAKEMLDKDKREAEKKQNKNKIGGYIRELKLDRIEERKTGESYYNN